VKINQLLEHRNKKLYEMGALFVLLIIVALIIDHLESSLFINIFSMLIKLSSLYGLILLSRRIREPIICPCCDADLAFTAYAKKDAKECPFCKIRFDQDSVAYKRRRLEIKENHEIVIDETFFDDA